MGEAPICQSCGSPTPNKYEISGEIVWLCPACAVESDIGCP